MAGRTARSRLDGAAARKGSCSESSRTPRRRLPEARPVAVQDAAMARRKAPRVGNNTRYYPLTRLLGAPSPRICEGDERDYGVPGAAKNTGDFAWLFEISISASARSTSVVPGERSEARDPYSAVYRKGTAYGSPRSRGRQQTGCG